MIRTRPTILRASALSVSGNVTRWIFSLLLAALFVGLQVRLSLYSGNLALPPTFDDVGYFNDAMDRLHQLQAAGPAALVQGYIANPPHAPIHTMLALAGFGLLQPSPWAAVAMNLLPLTFLLRLFFATTARVRLNQSGLIALALLGAPIFGFLVAEFRPDALCALLTAAGAATIIFLPEWRAAQWRPCVWVGLLLGAALLTKPTLAPMTVTLFGASAGFVLLETVWRHESRRPALFASLWMVGLGGVIAMPHYILAWRHYVAYIHEQVFGANATLWAPQLTLFDSATYYLTGPGGRLGAGPWFWLFLVVAPVAVLACARAIGHGIVLRRTLQFAMVLAIAWAGFTVPAFKSPFIGIVVPALIVSSIGVAAVMLLIVMPRRGGMVPLMLALFSAAAWVPPHVSLWSALPGREYIDDQNHIVAALTDALATNQDLADKRLYVPAIAQYINQDTLSFMLRARGAQPPHTDISYVSADLGEHQSLALSADYIIIFSLDSREPLQWTPSYRIRGAIAEAVEHSGMFESVLSIPSHVRGGTTTLLARRLP